MKPAALLFALSLLVACGSEDETDLEAEQPLTLADLEETAEARDFFDEGVVWCEGMSTDELRAFVDETYSAGAPKVMFAGIEEIEGRKLSAWLVIELPGAGSDRDEVFALYNRKFSEGGEPLTDTGQKFLSLMLD